MHPSVSGTHDHDRMAGRIASMVDREAALRQRQDEDYDLMDLACAVLYGADNETGLASLVPTWWADVLWWHYLDGATWQRTADAVGYSEQRCRQVRDTCLDTIDSWGIVGTMQAKPLNDVDIWARDERRCRNVSRS